MKGVSVSPTLFSKPISQLGLGLRRFSTLRIGFLALCLAPGELAQAAIVSGVYRTVASATAEEFGDRVPGQTRVVPISAILTFQLDTPEPSLMASISDAVLEGSAPFALEVRSAYGARRNDGSYWFTGDYLADITPTGTQYLFDWVFSETGDGQLLWNGITVWAGGHLWQVTVSNLTLVPDAPQPHLEIAVENAQLFVSWPASQAGYQLEQTASLTTPSWTNVTNAVVGTEGRLSITIDQINAQGFFRLRKP
jgi:hypothetical protein